VIYKAIGKAVVKLGKAFIVRRYGRQLQFGAGFLVVALGIGAFLASRNVPEG
jgi:hypothetical protein